MENLSLVVEFVEEAAQLYWKNINFLPRLVPKGKSYFAKIAMPKITKSEELIK
jgi:hypothetical protein